MEPRTSDRRAAERRRDPMGDEAANAALLFLVDYADKAGEAKAHVVYMEHFRKTELARLKRAAPPSERSDAARDAWARDHEDYRKVLDAQREAVNKHERLYWKRIAAEATIEAWRTKNANVRGAHKMV